MEFILSVSALPPTDTSLLEFSNAGSDVIRISLSGPILTLGFYNGSTLCAWATSAGLQVAAGAFQYVAVSFYYQIHDLTTNPWNTYPTFFAVNGNTVSVSLTGPSSQALSPFPFGARSNGLVGASFLSSPALMGSIAELVSDICFFSCCILINVASSLHPHSPGAAEYITKARLKNCLQRAKITCRLMILLHPLFV